MNELIYLRWNGVVEIVGSGRLAVIVAGIALCVIAAVWLASQSARRPGG